MTEQIEEQQVDRKDLKIQALVEKISTLTAQYENQAADYRVEITLMSTENNRLENLVHELQEKGSAEDVLEDKKKK